jgi:hypothetical protein
MPGIAHGLIYDFAPSCQIARGTAIGEGADNAIPPGKILLPGGRRS